MELNYGRQLLQQQKAYQEIDSLHKIMKQEFDSEIKTIRSRHLTLQNMIDRAATASKNLEELSEGLSRGRRS